MNIRKGNQLHIRVSLEHGLEALQCCVDSAAQGRRGHQVDIRVAREGLSELAALLMAEVCQDRVGNDMVGGAKIVNALYEPVVSSIEEQVMDTICMSAWSLRRVLHDDRWRGARRT